jgi:hypothetical protein
MQCKNWKVYRKRMLAFQIDENEKNQRFENDWWKVSKINRQNIGSKSLG